MTFKPFPELVLSEGPVITMKNGDADIDMQRMVDCWNACRKLHNPAAHIAETDAYIARLEELRKEAWARAEAAEAKLAAAYLGVLKRDGLPA